MYCWRFVNWTVSVCSDVMYCWRIVKWTVCLFTVMLCIVGGLWTELCVCLQWCYVLLADCELNCVSVCSDVMYCWRIVNWNVCLVTVRLCNTGGLWTELCVYLQWGYVMLADCKLNFVSVCSEVMYSWRVVICTVCLFAASLRTAVGLWTELCVW